MTTATGPRPDITAAITRPGVRVQEILRIVLDGYSDRPALGERETVLRTDPVTGRRTRELLPSFRTISYGELRARIDAVAADLRLRPGDVVGLLGFTSLDHTTVDLACVHLGAVCVPLQTSASAAQLKPVVAEIEPRVLATSLELLDTAVEVALSSTSVQWIVVFDYHEDDDDEREIFLAAQERFAVESLRDVLARGAALPAPPAHVPRHDEDPLSLLVYTSGSTGTPKGAMYTERLLRRLWLGYLPPVPDLSVIRVHYMPMSHLTGRAAVIETLVAGGIGYFTARSDLSTLFEDIALARPTELFLIPRLSDMLFQRYQRELECGVPEAEAMAVIREAVLGGRVERSATGSAPLSAELATFVQNCLGVRLHDGYGSTETGRIFVDGKVTRPPVIDYKVVDVPELGYFRTDTPHPRGELLVKTEALIPGYYKRPDLNAEIFDEDGFYRTGDIVAEPGPDQLVYLDRRKNVLKLSQGEFVAVSQVEAALGTSPLVRQIFVYGNSERAYLLAVVVPTGAHEKEKISESFHRIAQESGLSSYEIPREFIVETEPFSTANGLLSDLNKPLRPALRERYGPRLEQLYVELAEREAGELRALRAAGADQPVLPAICSAARALLGSANADARFTDLGGDSLSALSMANLLRDIFDVDVPVSLIISPATTLRGLADHIERAPRAARGPKTSVRAADLTLDKFIRPTPNTIGTVLLTGANGYLGRFVCLEWLRRLAATGGKLICLVRGGSTRLEEAFGDSELLRQFRELSGHVEVVSGELSEPDLGLPRRTWDRLAETVDLIVHPAALVNHVLPYEELLGPNVVGVAELIKLAITKRRKGFTFLSSIAVAEGEDTDVRRASPVRALDGSYANGYATSKWAGEVLLREAHERYGLPVVVLRSDMILAHSTCTGQLNVPDMFTRLLFSLIATGIAPRSFYRSDAEHYDGLPVDFVARVVADLGAPSAGYRTFNVVNPHEDGISLDTFVDWLVEAGHRIHRIDDHAEWSRRFEMALRALPEKQRKHSMLPLLHAVAAPIEPGPLVPSERFQAAVEEIPQVSRELIVKYADDLRSLGLL
ncbi:carboxylic acid reductase [Allokutzneria oryzae]|uniref:Carboxylic acid reductase n=1 Tax=Allokutzneria oryzae TaxID=1378989 RepID=A0ABV5ZU18_9PSEU